MDYEESYFCQKMSHNWRFYSCFIILWMKCMLSAVHGYNPVMLSISTTCIYYIYYTWNYISDSKQRPSLQEACKFTSYIYILLIFPYRIQNKPHWKNMRCSRFARNVDDFEEVDMISSPNRLSDVSDKKNKSWYITMSTCRRYA